MRIRRSRLVPLVCAVALVANGVGIWMSATALWLPVLGATAALGGLAMWAYRPDEEEAEQ